MTGDMQFIYTLLGHSADFLHDMFRCIFCLHNFSTGEDGPLRSIRDFDSLAESYACNPVDQSLHLNIVKKPLLYVELTKVVPFLMHSYVGMFQRSISALRRDCRKLDRHIAVDSRNPEILEQLQQKFETATAQTNTSHCNTILRALNLILKQ